jgi:hypothetical protein
VVSVDEFDKPKFFSAHIVSSELPMMIELMCFRAQYGGRTVFKAKVPKPFAASIADGIAREYLPYDTVVYGLASEMRRRLPVEMCSAASNQTGIDVPGPDLLDSIMGTSAVRAYVQKKQEERAAAMAAELGPGTQGDIGPPGQGGAGPGGAAGH